MATRKTTTVKKAVKAEKPVKTAKAAKPVEDKLAVSVVGLDGKAAGRVTLPKELFGAKVNKQLIAQAVRIYLANQRVGHASTKTRGEVEGSTRKIYRQKGTGRARHGAIRAPIFVGGGIVFGPKPRDYSMSLPQKMKKVALASALTSQLEKGNVVVMSGLSDVTAKTKVVNGALHAIGADKRTLLVVAASAENVKRAARNIERVDMVDVASLFTYAVVSHPKIVFMKEAIAELSTQGRSASGGK